MECRERTRGNIRIPGFRPAGILTAGTAQHLINSEGMMVGERIVAVGSGDIGLIMARRCVVEGARVEAGEKYVKCDTVLLSGGLIPEIELVREAGIPVDFCSGGGFG
jgi:hypothetical protein